MIGPLPLIAGLLGLLFLFVAAMYSLVPAGDLPSFFPGFEADSAQFHVKHAISSLVIALVLFAFSSQSALTIQRLRHRRSAWNRPEAFSTARRGRRRPRTRLGYYLTQT
jgi:hypothetical protein